MRELWGMVGKSLPPQSPFSRASLQSFIIDQVSLPTQFPSLPKLFKFGVEEKQNTAPKLGQPSMFFLRALEHKVRALGFRTQLICVEQLLGGRMPPLSDPTLASSLTEGLGHWSLVSLKKKSALGDRPPPQT